MPDNTIRVVARGDDIGSFHSANRAAEEITTQGICRNLSVLAVAPHVAEAAQLFAGRRDLCIGLHLTINGEWAESPWKSVSPAEKVPSLVDDGGFLLKTPNLTHSRGVVFTEITTELTAQLALLRRLGFDVAYADTHMSFGWLFEGADDSKRLEGVMEQWARSEGLLYVNTMPGLAWLPEPKKHTGDPVSMFISQLDDLQPGTYVHVVHPAFDDGEMRKLTLHGHDVAKTRDWDRRQFSDQAVVRFFRERDIRPATYREAAGA